MEEHGHEQRRIALGLLMLQRGILYGPVDSRRLGRSLGINLMPVTYKLCSFNCVYCHYGWTAVSTVDTHSFEADMPRPDDVIDAVGRALRSDETFEYLTFSGNGEPTLYPRFCSVLAEIVRLRDKHRPGLKIALLSNSSGLGLPDVQSSMALVDLPVFKLDAGTEEMFRCVNRPAQGVDFAEIIEHLRSLRGIYLQTVLFSGMPCNTGEEDLQAYFDRVRQIHPVAVQIYSIDRPVPSAEIRRVLPGDLARIAAEGKRATGIDFTPYHVR